MKKYYWLIVVILLYHSCKEPSVPYKKDALYIQKGEKIFNQQCVSCHNFKNNGIGPNLSGVTSFVNYEWLYGFIKDPQSFISSKDKRAEHLFKKYKVIMPSFNHLSDSEMEELLAFLHTKKLKETKVSSLNKEPLKDPIPEQIEKNGSRLDLVYLTQAPATSMNTPLARINKLVPLSNKSKRLFLSDLNGMLYELKGDKLLLILKIQDYFKGFISRPGLGSGLGSFAFHPDYLNNGLFYTSHTEYSKIFRKADFSYHDSIPKKMKWIITEWKQKNTAQTTFKGTHREILTIDVPTQIHGVQEICFRSGAGKNESDYGKLYIGIGDGGSAENKFLGLTQSTKKVWGTILRIDPLGNNSKNGNYGIPNDNPFVGIPGAVGEIWAYGFRNPNKISWDTNNGNMLVSDIGHMQIEEINLVKSGGNYGWPHREGSFAFYAKEDMDNVYALDSIENNNYIAPILQFDHDEANAICGGFVYQGKKIEKLKGKYIFGSIVHGKIFSANVNEFKLGRQSKIEEFDISYEGKISTLKEMTKNNRVDLRFGIDNNGELYILTKTDGKIYRINAVN